MTWRRPRSAPTAAAGGSRSAATWRLAVILCFLLPFALSHAFSLPPRLDQCEVVTAPKSESVSCPSGMVVLSGGVDCRGMHDNEIRTIYASFPSSTTAWNGICQPQSNLAGEDTGTPWALCCPSPQGAQAEGDSSDAPPSGSVLPQFESCRHRTNARSHPGFTDAFAELVTGGQDLCEPDEDLVAGGVQCRRLHDRGVLLSFRWLRITEGSAGDGRPARLHYKCASVNDNDQAYVDSVLGAAEEHVICCKRNKRWFDGHPARAMAAPMRPGQNSHLPRWRAGKKEDSERYRCASMAPQIDGFARPDDWTEAGICLLDPEWQAGAGAPGLDVSHLAVCGEHDLMLGIGVDCSGTRSSAQVHPAGQLREIHLSVNPDRPTYWRFNAQCVPWPNPLPKDAPRGPIDHMESTPHVSAFCYPQNCGNAPPGANLLRKHGDGSTTPFTTVHAPSQTSAANPTILLTCDPSFSFDGLGAVTEVERTCQPDFQWSLPLPHCVPTVPQMVTARDDPERILGALSSTFAEPYGIADVQLQITCSIGLAAKLGAPTRLPVHTDNLHEQFRETCVPVPRIPSYGFSAAALDSYSFEARWAPLPLADYPPPIEGVDWFYELRFNLMWPPNDALAADDTGLASLLRDGHVLPVGGDLRSSSLVVLVDSSRAVAQVQAGFSIRLANSNGEKGEWQKWEASVQLPCQCPDTPAHLVADPSVLPRLGALSIQQLFTPERNMVELQLQNWSPCVEAIEIQSSLGGASQLQYLQPLLRPSQCPSDSDAKLQRFRIPLSGGYAPHVSFSILRKPRTISPQSSLRYRFVLGAQEQGEGPASPQALFRGTAGALLSDSSSSDPDSASTSLELHIHVSGRLHTAISADSPDPAPLDDAEVTALFVRHDNFLDRETVRTSKDGSYELPLSTRVLQENPDWTVAQLRLLVSVSQQDSQGLYHQYRYAGTEVGFVDPDLSGKHTRHYRDVNFFDNSHIVLSGRITSEPRNGKWRAFSGCGVEGLRVAIYDAEQFKEQGQNAQALRISPATRTDGKWRIAAPKNMALAVFPIQPDADSQLERTFIVPGGSDYHVYNSESRQHNRTTEINFFDVTERTVKLRIYGGKDCKFPIGTAYPTFVHEGCGGRKVTMEEGFSKETDTGKEFTEYPGAPPVLLVVKGWDPIYRGHFQPAESQLGDLQRTAFQQQVHDWMDAQATVRLDLRKKDEEQHEFQFQAPLQVRLLAGSATVCKTLQAYDEDSHTPFVGAAGDAAAADPEYLVLPKDSSVSVTLELYEQYLDERCHQVAGSVFLHDLSHEDNFNTTELCPTGCVRKAEQDAEGKSRVSYTIRPNRVEWRNDTEWDVLEPLEHSYPAPPHSFPFYYRPADSVLPPKRTHVVVTGTAPLSPDAHRLTLRFPSAPLFLLHDPPGSMSKSSLERGDSIQLAQVELWTRKLGYKHDGFIGASLETRLLVGPPGVLAQTKKVEIRIGAATEMSLADSSIKENSLSSGYTYAQETSTSEDRGLVDGDASLALIHTGLIHLEESRELDPLGASDDERCNVAPPTPSLLWVDKGADSHSFSWISKRHIRKVLIPQIRRQIENIQANATENQKTSQLANLQASLQGWNDALKEFDISMERARNKWDPRTHAVTLTNGRNMHTERHKHPTTGRPDPSMPAAAQLRMLSPPHGEARIDSSSTDVLDPLRGFAQQQPTQWNESRAERQSGFLLSIDGGGAAHTFTMEIETSNQGMSKDFREIDTWTALDFKAGFAPGPEFAFKLGVIIGSSSEKGKGGAHGRKQKLSFTLGDADFGDAFDVEVRIDPKFNTPVFITRGGQSRCPYEQNTMPREYMRARLGYGQLSHVPPNSVARVPLLIDNRSPTFEHWSYVAIVDASTNPQGLHVTIAGQPISISGMGIYAASQQVSILTLELRRAPGMPYYFDGIELVIGPTGFDGGTGDGSDRWGYNGGDCPQDQYSTVIVPLSVAFQEECSRIEWSGLLKVMQQLTASSDPNTWSDAAVPGGKPAGTIIAVRNPEFHQIDRRWATLSKPRAPPRADEPVLLRDVQLQYRRLGGDETDWLDMVDAAGTVPNPKKDSDSMSGIFSFYWRTHEGLSDGLYEVRGCTRCFMPQGAIDSSLESECTPVKRVLVDHTPPTKFGEPSPGLALYAPGNKLEVPFSEQIQCLTPWSELTVRAWSHPPTNATCTHNAYSCCPEEFPACSANPSGYPLDPQPDVLTNQPEWTNLGNKLGGTPLSINYLCRDNVVHLSFDPKQSWTTLEGRLVTVMVWGARDLAFNPMERPITWTFGVQHFNVEGSLLRVKGASFEMQSEAAFPTPGSAAYEDLKQLLSEEIRALIAAGSSLASPESAGQAAAGRRLLEDAPPSPGSFGQEQVEVTDIRPGVRSIVLFDFNLLPSLHEGALSPADASASLAAAVDEGLHRDPTLFPLLATLQEPEAQPEASADTGGAAVSPPRPASAVFDMSIEVVMSAEDIAANAEAERRLLPDWQPSLEQLPPPPSDEPTSIECVLSSGRSVTLQVSYGSTLRPDSTATVDLSWHAVLAQGASPLSADDLRELGSRHLLVRWRQLPDTDLEDLDEIGEQEELDRRSWSPLFHTATPSAPLVHEVADTRHRLYVFHLPSVVTGREFELEVAAVTDSTPWRLFRHTVFVVGPPAPPSLLGFSQSSASNVSLRVQLSSFNGLTKQQRYNRFVQGHLRYELSVTSTNGTVATTRPLQNFRFDANTDAEGVTQIHADLALLSALPLPEPGTASQLTFTLTASNIFARSSASVLDATLVAVPGTVHKLRTRQLTLLSYEIQARMPLSHTPFLSFHSGYTFLPGVELHPDPQSPQTAAVELGPDGRPAKLTLRVQFPAPHSGYLPFHIYACACNLAGCSRPTLHRIYPVFLSAPLLSAVVQMQAPHTQASESQRQHAVQLQWRRMQEISHPALHTGYLVQWAQTDPSSPHSSSLVQQLQVSAGVTSLNLTGLLPSSPLRVGVFACMNHSSNYWVQRDPRGLHSIYSQPAAFVAQIRGPVAGPPMQSIAQISASGVQVRAVQPQPEHRRLEVEFYSLSFVCAQPQSVWNGVAQLASTFTLAPDSSRVDLSTLELPTVAAGDRLLLTLASQSFSVGGFSTPSWEDSTLRSLTMLGAPLPPQLLNVTQNWLGAGQDVRLSVAIRMAKLHTAESVQLSLERDGLPLLQVNPSLASAPTLPPLDRVLHVPLPEFLLQVPEDALRLSLSSSNVAGDSAQQHYAVRLFNPPPMRFPPNCCGYTFQSPGVPTFSLPPITLGVASYTLNPQDKLVRLGGNRPAHADWTGDCDTGTVEYFDEEARAWKDDVRVPALFGLAPYTQHLSGLFELRQNGELRYRSDAAQLNGVTNSVAGKLVRLQASCRAKQGRVPVCFQFVVKSFSAPASSIDPELALQTPIAHPTCTTPQQADARIGEAGTGAHRIEIEQIGAPVDIDTGAEREFSYSGSAGGPGSSACASARASAFAGAGQFSLPSGSLPTNVTVLPGLPPYPEPTGPPLPPQADAASTGGAAEQDPSSGSSAMGGSDSSTAAAAPAPMDPGTGTESEPEAGSTAPPSPTPPSGTGQTGVSDPDSSGDSQSVSSSTGLAAPESPPPAPASRPPAVAFSLRLASVPLRLLRDGARFVSSLRAELARAVHIAADRIRVLQAKTPPRAAGKEAPASKQARREQGPLRQLHPMATTTQPSASPAAAAASVEEEEAGVSDVQLSVAFEPPPASDPAPAPHLSSEHAFALLQAMHAHDGFAAEADSLLGRVAAVSDTSVELPLQACSEGVARASCSGPDDAEWTEGSVAPGPNSAEHLRAELEAQKRWAQMQSQQRAHNDTANWPFYTFFLVLCLLLAHAALFVSKRVKGRSGGKHGGQSAAPVSGSGAERGGWWAAKLHSASVSGASPLAGAAAPRCSSPESGSLSRHRPGSRPHSAKVADWGPPAADNESPFVEPHMHLAMSAAGEEPPTELHSIVPAASQSPPPAGPASGSRVRLSPLQVLQRALPSSVQWLGEKRWRLRLAKQVHTAEAEGVSVEEEAGHTASEEELPSEGASASEWDSGWESDTDSVSRAVSSAVAAPAAGGASPVSA